MNKFLFLIILIELVGGLVYLGYTINSDLLEFDNGISQVYIGLNYYKTIIGEKIEYIDFINCWAQVSYLLGLIFIYIPLIILFLYSIIKNQFVEAKSYVFYIVFIFIGIVEMISGFLYWKLKCIPDNNLLIDNFSFTRIFIFVLLIHSTIIFTFIVYMLYVRYKGNKGNKEKNKEKRYEENIYTYSGNIKEFKISLLGDDMSISSND